MLFTTPRILMFHSQEHTINPLTGQEAYFVTTKKPLIDTEGNINILGVVNNITEQKKHEQELRKSEYLLQQIFDKVADGLLLIESETLRILEANPKALEILGAGQKNEIVGQHIQVIRLVREPSARFWKNLFIQIQADNPVHEAEMLDLSDRPFWGSLATSSFEQESRGRILLRISDISAQKKTEEQIMQALHEKEILIQEIHHRVKNNMAVISSLLQLQTGYIKDPALIDVFRDSQSRIKSMALIHEKLYQSKTLAKVEMDSYIKELTRTLFFTYNSRRIDLKIQTQVDNVYLDINAAVPCGLIINEVISNACKHAFTGRDKGLIDIRFEKKGPQYVLEISDDGVGMPSNVDFSGFKSLGMNLVQALSSQLGAKLEIFTQGGVTIRLAFTEKVKPGRENIQP
jgi:PAS domain S-box-containing protein